MVVYIFRENIIKLVKRVKCVKAVVFTIRNKRQKGAVVDRQSARLDAGGKKKRLRRHQENENRSQPDCGLTESKSTEDESHPQDKQPRHDDRDEEEGMKKTGP